MARFVAIDVETANAKRASICQIGLVVYDNRKVVDEWSTLINPEDSFAWRQGHRCHADARCGQNDRTVDQRQRRSA